MGEAPGNLRALIVAGPTCSGKSALALALAERLDGTVINADAMQVYRELRVLTARPSPADEQRVPHALYGVRPAAENSSAAWWREAAIAAMREATGQGRLPILCGGTGLYLASLTQRLAAIPDPGDTARAQARHLAESLGPQGLHARLAAVDPLTASRLRPTDSQRLARAWEVLAGTGRGLASWQDERGRCAPSCSIHHVTPCGTRSTPASRRCWRTVRSRKCGPCWHRGCPPPCRRCVHMACRKSRPICAAICRWAKLQCGHALSPGNTPSGRPRGFDTDTLQPKAQRIGSLRVLRAQRNLWKVIYPKS
jgi:hypothetical protein